MDSPYYDLNRYWPPWNPPGRWVWVVDPAPYYPPPSGPYYPVWSIDDLSALVSDPVAVTGACQ